MSTPKGARVLRDPLFQRVKDTAIQRTGMAYWCDKDEALADLVAQLLESRHLRLDQLVAHLDSEYGQGPETQALIDAVTVGETFFFRYREQFDAIEQHILPERMARNRASRTLSIWSAGCSNGAEPYSLAFLLERRFGVQLADWRVDVLGTDISRQALALATAACYGDWTVRDMPADLRAECFQRQGNCWRVRPTYRRRVRFLRHNLVTEPAPLPAAGGRFDLIVCRNVLMYFDAPTRERVLNGFLLALAEDGWLVVGHAEAGPHLGGQFISVPLPSCTLYRKPSAHQAVPRVSPAAAPHPRPRPRSPVVEGEPELLARALLDQGDYSRAVTFCRAWADTAPLDPAPYYFLGLAQEPVAEDQAIAAYRRALFLAPHLALAHFNLLRLFQRRGARAEARRHYVAVMADLSNMAEDQRLPLGASLTAGELAAIARRIGAVA